MKDAKEVNWGDLREFAEVLGTKGFKPDRDLNELELRLDLVTVKIYIDRKSKGDFKQIRGYIRLDFANFGACGIQRTFEAKPFKGLSTIYVDETLGVLDPIPSGLIKNEAECLEALAPSYENYPPKEPVSVADIPEEVKESVLERAEAVTTLVHPEMQVVSKEIKDLSEDGTLTVDVKAIVPNTVDHIDVQIKAKPAAPQELPVVENVEKAKLR